MPGWSDQDQDQDEYVIEILQDGNVLLPRGHPILGAVAEALGDADAKLFCDQAGIVDVVLGKRMCG